MMGGDAADSGILDDRRAHSPGADDEGAAMTDPYGSGRSGGGSWGQPAPQGTDPQAA